MLLNKLKLNRLNKVNKQELFVIGIAFIVITGIAFAASYSLATNSDKASTVSASPLGSKENPHQVALTKDQDSPIDLIVKSGDYVQFNSKDGKDHQIVRGPATKEHGATSIGHEASEISSGVINSDEGYLLPFNNTGKYEFHDNYNHHYTITILVYAP